MILAKNFFTKQYLNNNYIPLSFTSRKSCLPDNIEVTNFNSGPIVR